MTGYAEFIDRKAQSDVYSGFDPGDLPGFLFDFQRDLVAWAIRKGKAAIFADCGLGKTPIQLVWASEIHRHTGKPVLIITPLAVSSQTIEEGAKFGIGVTRDDGPIRVTNYEQIEHHAPEDYAGVVCDESSAIKSFAGKRRALVTAFMRKIDYRLLCTATAAPNDYVELGTSSEALGQLGHMDMLSRFFVNKNNTADTRGHWRGHGAPRQWERQHWRFKGHAEHHFWRWVCSWARAVRRPSDLGYDDGRFILPDLVEREHIVDARRPAPGMLFDLAAFGLREEREEARRTIAERCEMAADLVNHDQPAVAWCNLNDEADLLERLIPDAVQVAGRHTSSMKEDRLLGFQRGDFRVLVTKPKIGAWGLNWQHCAHMTFFPTHSFEQYYQAVRRCWRFGQEREVKVDIVTTSGGAGIRSNLQRKAKQADDMFESLVRYMRDTLTIRRTEAGDSPVEVPSWLS